MRLFFVATVCFIGAFVILIFATELVFDNIETKAAYKDKIKDLEQKLKAGNNTILKADSVIKANTIYIGCCPDTIVVYRWLTNKNFKRLK